MFVITGAANVAELRGWARGCVFVITGAANVVEWHVVLDIFTRRTLPAAPAGMSRDFGSQAVVDAVDDAGLRLHAVQVVWWCVCWREGKRL